jgi:hypothetical protein
MKALLIAAALLVSATYTYAGPKGTKSTGSSTGNKSATQTKSVNKVSTNNKTGTTNKVTTTNNKSVFSGKTTHAQNFTKFQKTFHGHHAFARNYCGWTHRCWFPRFGCYGYYCPSTCCWYYLYETGDCYLPVDAMTNFPPAPPSENGENGTPVLPEGAEPISDPR